MSKYEWSLHAEPYRHYKVSVNGKKPTWNANGKRIKSVTQVLGGDGLASWAAGQATAACERVMVDWFGCGPDIARSVLSVGQLAAFQPEWPDNVRDAKGESGTALHHYLGARLLGNEAAWLESVGLPIPLSYGLRVGVDDFLRDHMPVVLHDRRGACVERIVGDPQRAIAGTYDALARMGDGVHRIDLKQSNYVKDEMFAQLAAYERCDRAHRADYLTILHVSPGGTYDLHSIAVGSKEHRAAMALFDAHLTISRSPKLLKRENPA